MNRRRAVLALLPFLVRGALSIAVLREMRRRGLDVVVAYYAKEAVGYARDALDEFDRAGRLVDLSNTDERAAIARLKEICHRFDVGLVLQIGAPDAYRQLPTLRRALGNCAVLDTLYNPVGHVVLHFLYERAFDGVIVESHAMAAFYRANARDAEPTVHLVESGIDLGHFVPADRSEQRPPTIGWVGRLSPEKNPLAFVRWAEAVHASLPALRFAIYGEGAMVDEVRATVEASPARDAIAVNGYAPSVRDAFQAIDALAVPSLVDGRPNAIMEANACGVPVIAAPVGGIPELIVDGVNGRLVEPADTDRVVATLRDWTAGDRLADLRRASRRHAERHFDRARMMDAYQAVFEGALRDGPRRRP